LSVGLGGNIANSLRQIEDLTRVGQPIPPRFDAGGKEDAGNGSIMRLAAIPLRFHGDVALARERSYESSLTTHPGPMAAEACAFMAHVIVRALHRPAAPETTTAAQFLDACCREYLTVLGAEPVGAKGQLARLLRSDEAADSLERCWNWRAPDLDLEGTVHRRGKTYNGYPVPDNL
jgi:hypothetical protein